MRRGSVFIFSISPISRASGLPYLRSSAAMMSSGCGWLIRRALTASSAAPFKLFLILATFSLREKLDDVSLYVALNCSLSLLRPLNGGNSVMYFLVDLLACMASRQPAT